MKIDFDHWQGENIAQETLAILHEKRELQIIEMLKPEFTKDGNMFCYTYPNNKSIPENCVQGFGETASKAAHDFVMNWYNQKAHLNNKK